MSLLTDELKVNDVDIKNKIEIKFESKDLTSPMVVNTQIKVELPPLPRIQDHPPPKLQPIHVTEETIGQLVEQEAQQKFSRRILADYIARILTWELLHVGLIYLEIVYLVLPFSLWVKQESDNSDYGNYPSSIATREAWRIATLWMLTIGFWYGLILSIYCRYVNESPIPLVSIFSVFHCPVIFIVFIVYFILWILAVFLTLFFQAFDIEDLNGNLGEVFRITIVQIVIIVPAIFLGLLNSLFNCVTARLLKLADWNLLGYQCSSDHRLNRLTPLQSVKPCRRVDYIFKKPYNENEGRFIGYDFPYSIHGYEVLLEDASTCSNVGLPISNSKKQQQQQAWSADEKQVYRFDICCPCCCKRSNKPRIINFMRREILLNNVNVNINDQNNVEDYVYDHVYD